MIEVHHASFLTSTYGDGPTNYERLIGNLTAEGKKIISLSHSTTYLPDVKATVHDVVILTRQEGESHE